jgi:hypothetical protein
MTIHVGTGFRYRDQQHHVDPRLVRPRLRRRQSVGLALPVAVLVSALACTGGRGASDSVLLQAVDNVTYLGCVDRDQQSSRHLLRTLDEPAAADPAPHGHPQTTESTSVGGPWPGTRQLELVGDQADAIAGHAGRRVRVTGMLEEQLASTGKVDQLQGFHGVAFRRLRASAFEVVEGGCALRPQHEQPPTHGPEH